ncbi:MAG TPA: hypothetical protein VM073_10580 [Usitatibacter sp.]|nr:hypothetical protein [Usitatibacter sp.]
MKTPCRLVASLVTSLGLVLPASATTFSTDYSDIWYNAPAESQAGWGVNIAQQRDILFVTMFIFDQANQPHWYVASNVNATGPNSYTGQLFNIGSGTYFGAPWAGISGVAAVGNIAFTFNSPTTGSMTYTINNVQVTKQIVRQSWRSDNLQGNWFGGVVAAGSGCSTGILINGEITVTHAQPNISLRVEFTNNLNQPGICTYNGTYSQVGRMGAINNGSYSCTINGVGNALSGTFSVSEMQNSRTGFSGTTSGTASTGAGFLCNYSGYMGGVRDVF